MVGFTLFVPMKPQPKERPRLSRGHTFTPPKTVAAEKWIHAHFKREFPDKKPIAGIAIGVDITAFFLRPKSRAKLKEKFHTIRPDADNLAKVIDALNGIAWEDDCLIAELHVCKLYCDTEEEQGLLIICEALC